MSTDINDLISLNDNPPADFQEYLDQYAGVIGDLVNRYIPHGDHPDMDRYLYGPLMKYSKNGGKRHRPLIALAGCLVVGGDMNKAISSAAAIEHFHTAALIHDDIADEAELRRGEPCLHLSEGLGLALNMGDLGLSLVNGTVINDPALDNAVKVRVVTELIEMTRRAIVGGGTEAQIEGLRNFGLDTGLAFQIQDDLLNLIGEEESTKKDFRSDITEGKRTLIVVHALHHGTEQQRARLVEILSNKEKNPDVLAEAVEIMQETGSIEYARNYAQNLTSISKNRLLGVVDPSPARDLLVSMADWFVNRLD